LTQTLLLPTFKKPLFPLESLDMADNLTAIKLTHKSIRYATAMRRLSARLPPVNPLNISNLSFSAFSFQAPSCYYFSVDKVSLDWRPRGYPFLLGVHG
jgi:hypothetical protein